MTVTHPLARREGGAVPGGYTYGTTTYPIDSDGTIDCPPDVEEAIAEALADRYGADVTDIYGPGEETCDVVKSDGEVCGRDLPCQYHPDEGD